MLEVVKSRLPKQESMHRYLMLSTVRYTRRLRSLDLYRCEMLDKIDMDTGELHGIWQDYLGYFLLSNVNGDHRSIVN
jgi:hypothetical protein